MLCRFSTEFARMHFTLPCISSHNESGLTVLMLSARSTLSEGNEFLKQIYDRTKSIPVRYVSLLRITSNNKQPGMLGGVSRLKSGFSTNCHILRTNSFVFLCLLMLFPSEDVQTNLNQPVVWHKLQLLQSGLVSA